MVLVPDRLISPGEADAMMVEDLLSQLPRVRDFDDA